MISVGKHSNIVISSISESENADLVIQFKQMAAKGGKLSRLSTVSIDSSNAGQTTDFKLWALKTLDWQGAPAGFDKIVDTIAERQELLTYIASQYMTLDKIQPVIDSVLKAVGVTDANMEKELVKADVVAKYNAALNSAFIKLLKPFIGESSKQFAVIFPRTSEKSHFPKLRSKFLSTQGFMAPMDQPELVAKLEWTKYEQGYRKGDEDGKPSGWDASNPNKLDGATLITSGATDAQLAEVADIFAVADVIDVTSTQEEVGGDMPF